MNNSQTSKFCSNGCQLFRELVSGGLLAGGLFWVAATLILFTSELLGDASAGAALSGSAGLIQVIASALGNIVDGMPGYRTVLGFAAASMIIQSRTIGKLEPWKGPLLVSGIVGLGVQLYIGLAGGAMWVSAIFLTLIVAGLVLSVVWLVALKRDQQPPVFVDNQGHYFIKQPVDKKSDSSEARYGKVLSGTHEAPASINTTASMTSQDEGGRIDPGMDIDLPPLPESHSFNNVAPFPGKFRKSAENDRDHLAVDEIETEALDPDKILIDDTMEMDLPEAEIAKLHAAMNEEVSNESRDDHVHGLELDKTMILERPAFLDEQK